MSPENKWLLRGKGHRMDSMVTGRDGCSFATDAHVPGGPVRPRPTIVERTPYGRRSNDLLGLAAFFVERDYNVVLQDTRGRGGSGGIFQHYFARPHEGEDGSDLLDWICAQPWSDGTVGTTGMSYTGSNQQSLAITGHKALKSQIIMDAGLNYFRRTVREEGAFVIGQLGTYALRMALSSPEVRRDPIMRARLEHARDHAADWFDRAPWRIGHSPVSAHPAIEKWLIFAQDNGHDGEGWRNPQMNIEPHLADYPDIPMLIVTSWYGHHAWSAFRKLDIFSHHAAPLNIIVGTWLHADPYGETSHVGQTAFGPDACLNMNEISLRWFDATLKGKGRDNLGADPRISYFTMGGGTGRRSSGDLLEHGGAWNSADSWPPVGGRDLALFLSSEQSLRVHSPTAPSQDTMTVDPARPVPTIGSSIKNPDIMPGFLTGGGYDQVERADVHQSPGSGLPLASRGDVLALRTDVLTENTVITGAIAIRLWISADVRACDLSVKIVDEYPPSADWPNGFSLNIAEHYQRFATWTEELSGDIDLPQLVEIGPIHLSNVFVRGHRIRLQIANSNWPRFDRNPETPGPFRFRVWGGGATASCILGAGALRPVVADGQ